MVQTRCPGHTFQLSGLSDQESELVDFVSCEWETKKGVVTLYLPIGPLKTRSGFDEFLVQASAPRLV